MPPFAMVSGLIPLSTPPVVGAALAVPETVSVARVEGREGAIEGFSQLLERQIENFNKSTQDNEKEEQNIDFAGAESELGRSLVALDPALPGADDPAPPELQDQPLDQPITVLPLVLPGAPPESKPLHLGNLPGNELPLGRQELLPVPPPARDAGLAARAPLDGGWALALGRARRSEQADPGMPAAPETIPPSGPGAPSAFVLSAPVVPPQALPGPADFASDRAATSSSAPAPVLPERPLGALEILPAGQAVAGAPTTAPRPDDGSPPTAHSDAERIGAVARRPIRAAGSELAIERALRTTIAFESQSGVPAVSASASSVGLPGLLSSQANDAAGGPPLPVSVSPKTPAGQENHALRPAFAAESSLAGTEPGPASPAPGTSEVAGGGVTSDRVSSAERYRSSLESVHAALQVAGQGALRVAEAPDRMSAVEPVTPRVAAASAALPQQTPTTEGNVSVGPVGRTDGALPPGMSALTGRAPEFEGEPTPVPGAAAVQGRAPLTEPATEADWVATTTGMPAHRIGARHSVRERGDGVRSDAPGPVVSLTETGADDASAGLASQLLSPGTGHAVQSARDGAPQPVVGPTIGPEIATLASEDPLLRAPADSGSDSRLIQAAAVLDAAAPEARAAASMHASAAAAPAAGGGRTELATLTSAPVFAGPVLPFQASAGPGFSEDLGHRILWLSGNRLRGAEIQLDPPELGPLQVQVHAHRDGASVQFVTHSAAARDAVEASLPKLREMLEASGLNLLDVNVAQQQERGGRDGAQTPWGSAHGSLIAPEAVTGVTSSAGRVRLGLVDDYA